jgi:hypothetical protein
MVLGVQWLQTLGTYSANHQKHFIIFKWQGKRYKLYGFQPPQTQVVSSRQMEKLILEGSKLPISSNATRWRYKIQNKIVPEHQKSKN